MGRDFLERAKTALPQKVNRKNWKMYNGNQKTKNLDESRLNHKLWILAHGSRKPSSKSVSVSCFAKKVQCRNITKTTSFGRRFLEDLETELQEKASRSIETWLPCDGRTIDSTYVVELRGLRRRLDFRVTLTLLWNDDDKHWCKWNFLVNMTKSTLQWPVGRLVVAA